MSVIYIQANEEVKSMAREIIEQHHPELVCPGGEYVRLCIMMAMGDSGEPTVKVNGVPKSAVVTVIPYKQRVDKRADAEIIVDSDVFKNASERQQRAILDGCITALEIQKDEIGSVKTDDEGRPKIRLRICDWNLNGFRSIAQRYGSDAPEVAAARKFKEEYGDAVFAEDKLFA